MSTLFLVATPIGNLEDMSPRAVRILKEVTLIAAEDTRHSRKLLNHFEIDTSLTSFFEFSKPEKLQFVIEKLKFFIAQFSLDAVAVQLFELR